MISDIIGRPGGERRAFWRGFRAAWFRTHLWLSPVWAWLALRFFGVLVLCCALVPSHVHACDDSASETPDTTCVVMKNNGRPGIWYELQTADELRREHRLLPQLQLQVEKLTFADAICTKETKTLRQTLALMEDSARNQQKQTELAAEDARAAREALASEKRWYKSPIFWGIVMFVAGAAIQNACCSGK